MKKNSILFILDNFRIMHVEQINSVSEFVKGRFDVYGCSIFNKSSDYDFGTISSDSFIRNNLYDDSHRDSTSELKIFLKIITLCIQSRAKYIFISHYERRYVYFSSILLRIFGKRVVLLNDSKFDDYKRHMFRELGKRVLYLPYYGGISASLRGADYLRFLGIPESRIRTNCYTASRSRIWGVVRSNNSPPQAHAERHFLCVARLVPKKNITMLIQAFATYKAQSESRRKLILCGSGGELGTLVEQVRTLGITSEVIFCGNLPSTEVIEVMARSLCLLLPSVEEQFGIVVLEALAAGLPILLADNCGARDTYVRSGVNGFVIEPDNPDGWAYFMQKLSDDEALWRRMSAKSAEYATKGDTKTFVDAVMSFIDT